MRKRASIILAIVLIAISRSVSASQANDTTITITAQIPGATPFFSQLTLSASDTTVLKNIQFAIAPKPTSVTRPLSATYSKDYLLSRGYLQPATGTIFLPVYGLYAGFANIVTLTYNFVDGSSKQDSTIVTTATFVDPCGLDNPTVLQARTDSRALSYDYIMVKRRCTELAPAIIDTDGAVRWVGTAGVANSPAAFFDNAVYQGGAGGSLYRIDLDGTVTLLHNYNDIGVTAMHHNIDRGKFGLILDVNTTSYFESENIEVDSAGNVLKIWNLAEIISNAMVTGGDDPSEFVLPTPADWFHNNAVAYNRADDSLIISSRQNFLICIDYETGAIKWILGDPTKKWHQFPSLAKFALALAPGSLPPIGQHAVSITADQNLLVFDNGFGSLGIEPPGETRTYASPRKYQLNLEARVATEVWNYEMDQSIRSPVCSSVYEDAPINYLIDYSFVGGFVAQNNYSQLLGLDAGGNTVFYYQYPATQCERAFNAIPVHLENTKFPAIGPQVLNISTRGTISSGEKALIGGFIVTGSVEKKVALRVLGPSLSDSGLSVVTPDPVLALYDSSGSLITSNDNWKADATASEISSNGLAPGNALEAATVQTVAPGAYTVVATDKNATPGIGLVEVYDLSSETDSRLANISTRGSVGTGDDVLIGGFIVGEVANSTVIVRALGPSLSPTVDETLKDPTITTYDGNGAAISTNDDWQDDINKLDVEKNGLAPANKTESATILHPPAGAYSVVVSGADGGTGVALVEVYNLN